MYLIIGGNSFLGSYIIKNIIDKTNENIIATYYSGTPFLNNSRISWIKCDISQTEDIQEIFSNIKNNDKSIKCIYLAGYIKPDEVEKNPHIAWKVNIGGLTKFIDICGDYLSCLYFASTDMVFSEDSSYSYSENDVPIPMNKYGELKYIAEKIVISAGFNVFRCPLMYGKSLIPNRIHFIDHVEQCIKNKEYFDVLSDYYESTLDYDSVAKLLLELINKNPQGKIIHIAADEPITKYEIAIEYAKKYNLDSSYIKPLPLDKANFFIAKRGTVTLDNTNLKSICNIKKIERKY